MKNFCESLREHAMQIINLKKIKLLTRGDAHSICHLNYRIPKKNFIVFHNGSNYDYHFNTKELAEEFFKKVLKKYQRIHNLYNSNRKRSYKNW